MKFLFTASYLLLSQVATAFTVLPFSSVPAVQVCASATEAGVPAATSSPDSDVADMEIPTNLPSECGMDYVPLATLLATGQLAEADQVSVVQYSSLLGSVSPYRRYFFLTIYLCTLSPSSLPATL